MKKTDPTQNEKLSEDQIMEEIAEIPEKETKKTRKKSKKKSKRKKRKHNKKNIEENPKKKWIIWVVLAIVLVLLGTGAWIAYDQYQIYQAELAKKAQDAINDAVVKNDAYTLALETFHQHAVDDIDDNKGEQFADAIADLGMDIITDINGRPPYVELTDENRATFATVESVLIDPSEVSKVVVSVTANEMPISDDGYYYLFSYPMYEDNISGEPITKIEKDVDFQLSCKLNYNSEASRLFDKFCVAVKLNGAYVQVSRGKYITNPEARASTATSREGTGSKKGLLVDPVLLNSGQLTDLGVKHGAYNVFMSLILGETTNGAYPTIYYTYNGKSYSFNGESISMYDTVFSSLTAQGIDVNAILINDLSGSTLTNPSSRGAGATLYAYNVADEAGVDYLAAVCTFLASRYTGSGHGKVSNWIIGNEVNERAIYNYTPYMGVTEYAHMYADTVRVCYNAMCAVNKTTRVYVSFDQRWNMNKSDKSFYDVRDMLDAYNSYILEEGNFDWNVGFHPYNYPLPEPKAWDLGRYNSSVTNSVDTACITIRNIHVLTDYLCRDNFRNTEGGVRHVILSEMGYTSYFGQQYQAASYAYAYKIMMANQYIDYMLLSRQTDAGIEVADKLATGINSSGYGKKEVYNVFKYCGTDQESAYIDKYLGVIGVSSWSAVTNPR